MMFLLAQDKVRYGVGWPFLVPAETLEPWMQQSSNRGTLGKGSPPGQSGNLGRDPLLANEIAALVPMDTLISELGFSLNMRTRRTRCLIHGGDNPTSLSWTEDGLWHCFSCGRGGDKFKIIMEVRRCSFRIALSYLAGLAGVEPPHSVSASLPWEFVKRREAQAIAEQAAAALAVRERQLIVDLSEDLIQLVKLRESVTERMRAIQRGDLERFSGEEKIAWEALELCALLPEIEAALDILTFGSPVDRIGFLRASNDQRKEMIHIARERGFICDQRGRMREIS